MCAPHLTQKLVLAFALQQQLRRVITIFQHKRNKNTISAHSFGLHSEFRANFLSEIGLNSIYHLSCPKMLEEKVL